MRMRRWGKQTGEEEGIERGGRLALHTCTSLGKKFGPCIPPVNHELQAGRRGHRLLAKRLLLAQGGFLGKGKL